MEEGFMFTSQDQTVGSVPPRESGLRNSVLQDSLPALTGALVFGMALFLINIRWPVARNALDYMKSSLEIIERHFDLVSVAREHLSIGGKPLLFSLMATPFVWLFGANTGIVATSGVGTCFFLVTVVFTLNRLFRINHGGRSDWISLGLTLTALNPLIMYQFWSGYPDSLFAGLILLAFILSDNLVEVDGADARRRILLLGLTIGVAVHAKLYGVVLLVTCPLYILMRSSWKPIRFPWSSATTVFFGVVWLILFVVLALAKLGYDPLLVFDANSGFGEYFGIFQGPAAEFAVDSLWILFFSILMAFHISLVFLLRREAWSMRSLAPMMFIGLYVIGLLPSMGTGVNMRYFLPVFPFVASMLVAGVHATPAGPRRAILGSYSVLAAALVLDFNVAAVESTTHEMMTRAYSKCPSLTRWLDNLRLPVHIALKRQIDAINKYVPDGSILYWSSDYYKTATHGLAYHLGVKRSLDVRYVLESSYPKYNDRPVFLTEFTSAAPPAQLWRAPSWAIPVSYGDGLFRLDPASVRLTALSGDFVTGGRSLEIRADTGVRDPYTVGQVEFFESNTLLAKGKRPPFEMKWSDPPFGRHEIVARVDYVGRPSITSAPLDIYVGVRSLERIADDTDDLIAEYEDSIVQATQDVLQLNQRLRVLGIRFRNINVQRGVVLSNARLRFTSPQAQAGRTLVEIRGELSPNAEGLRLVDGDLSNRSMTTFHVIWEPGPWMVGQVVESPDLAPVLEQIFSQKNWQSGNSLLLLIQLKGKDRSVQAATVRGREAPRLQITLK
jgi:hypothetical protein